MLTIQKGYANASEGELLPVVAEVVPLSQGVGAPAAPTGCNMQSSASAPRALQWLENDRKASTECPPALSRARFHAVPKPTQCAELAPPWSRAAYINIH